MPPEVAETTVAAIIQNQPKAEAKEPSRITVVTPDNFDAYVEKQLPPKPVSETETPEAKAKEELAKVESEKKDEEIDHPDEHKKGKLNERFSELTAKRKAAEEKAEKAAQEAKANREAREKAEGELQAMKMKYEPPKTELDPEPTPAQFTDINEYSKALKEWTADKTLRDEAKKQAEAKQKQEQEDVVKAWNERQGEFKKKTEDYDQVIAGSDVKVSDQVQSAILDSEVGPQILYHLAKNPDHADRLGKMTVGRALKEIGRLEASFTKEGGEKTEAPKTPVAEISKAPAPITPIKGASAPVVRLSGSDEVPKSMNYDDWKKLRQAGKIK